MRETAFDLAIVGCGPGGQAAALQARELGKNVVVVDRSFTGAPLQNGTGVLAIQALRLAARNLAQSRHPEVLDIARERGLFEDVRHGALQAMQRARDELDAAGVRMIEGTAGFVSAKTLSVRNQWGEVASISAQRILIASGSHPRSSPKGLGKNGASLDVHQLFSLPLVPESLTIVGNGYVAAELTSVFAHLGVKIHLVDNCRPMLPSFDKESVDVFLGHLLAAHVTMHKNCEVKHFSEDLDGARIHLSDGQLLRTQYLVFAIGRTGQLEDLQLHRAGITSTPDTIAVDDHFRTNIENIYAIGDVIGRPRQAAVARRQGSYVVRKMYDANFHEVISNPPLALYAIPEIAQIGETESSAGASGRDIRTGRCDSSDLPHALGRNTSGMVKLVFDAATMRLIGASIIGDGAVDLIHFCQLAIQSGTTASDLIGMTFCTPTRAEAIARAALQARSATISTRAAA